MPMVTDIAKHLRLRDRAGGIGMLKAKVGQVSLAVYLSRVELFAVLL